MSGSFGPRELAERLGDRIDTLCQQLLRNGVYDHRGRQRWRVGSIRGEAGKSLCVWLQGERRGRWKDYASGEAGDALDLVAAVLYRGDLGQACAWARDWLGLGSLSTEALKRIKKEAERARTERSRQVEREAATLAQNAKRQWLAGAVLTRGDPGWSYLVGRDVGLDPLLPEAGLPAALRVHSALWNPESGRARSTLMAAICGPDGRHINTHRIWLEVLGDGRVRKAPLQQPKLSMPSGYGGGCVRLWPGWRGRLGRKWRDMPAGETLAAGEGIEDTLTIACVQSEWPYAAVLSASSLERLILPPQVARLVWLGQNDPRHSSAETALRRALAPHRAAGREVATLRPPVFVKDHNEFAQWLRRVDAEAAMGAA